MKDEICSPVKTWICDDQNDLICFAINFGICSFVNELICNGVKDWIWSNRLGAKPLILII